MSRWRSSRHSARLAWLVGAALFAVAPKCVLCVGGYLGLATALGLGGSELCGGPRGGNVAAAAIFAQGGGVSMAAAICVWLRTSHINPTRPKVAALPGRSHRYR